MDNSADSIEKKSQARFLRLLSKQNTPVAICEQAEAFCITIGVRKYTFKKCIVKECFKRNLVDRTQDRVSISAEGKAVLVQLLHPDLSFRSQHISLVQKVVSKNAVQAKVMFNENESPLSRLFYR